MMTARKIAAEMIFRVPQGIDSRLNRKRTAAVQIPVTTAAGRRGFSKAVAFS